MAVALALMAITAISAQAMSAQPTGLDPASPQQSGQRAAPSEKGIYWGAWIGPHLPGEQAPSDMSAASAFAGIVGKRPSLLEFSGPFSTCDPACTPYRFPTSAMEAVRRYGAIPVFSWASQPNPGSLKEPGYQLSDIASGAFDPYIREFAESARAWGHPFFLRFNWEMNGRWFPWGAGMNGNSRGGTVAAWRHVHDIFTAVGATNATWVWCRYADAPRRFGIRGMFESLATRYPQIRALTWFDQSDRDLRWPIESSKASVEVFSQGVRDRRYGVGRYASIASKPILPPR